MLTIKTSDFSGQKLGHTQGRNEKMPKWEETPSSPAALRKDSQRS